jgi:uroporphyrinogen-III synthase
MTEIVILTSSLGAFPGLVEALREIPVAVEERPLLSFEPPLDWAPLDSALDRARDYVSIAFTSPRAARAVVGRMEARCMSWSPGPGNPGIWAVGPTTAAALRGMLGSVRLPVQGHDSNAGALARVMLQAGGGGPVLFPCGESRRDELSNELRKRGIEVDEVVCYRSVLADESEARAVAARGTVLIAASPRVVDLLARVCPRGSRPELLVVGPTTAASARAAGWSPDATASEPTAAALASAITALLDKH